MTGRNVLLCISVLSSLTLAACQSGQPAAGTPAGGSATPAQTGEVQLPGPLHATLALVGQPAVTTSGKNIFVTVAVTNTGTEAFGSTSGPYGVNLGAHAIDAAGKVVNLNLARAQLPQIPAGATKQASIRISVQGALGHRVELLPVDEGVAWFDKWGNKPLIIGPFQACAGGVAAKVCDAAGKPLAVATTAQP